MPFEDHPMTTEFESLTRSETAKITILYVILTISLFTGLPLLVIPILVYVVWPDTFKSVKAKDHVRWINRAVIFGIVWFIIATVLFISIIGYFFGLILWGIVWLWLTYRILKGYVALSENRSP